MAHSESQPLSSRNIQNSLDLLPESPNRPAKVAKLISDDEEDSELIDIEQSMNQKPGIQRYLLAVEYIGTRFWGAQQQPTGRTVVGVLQEAFRKFIGQPVSVTCSSRTDAGVHALSSVFHVDVERVSKRKPGELLPPHEPGVVIKAVNHFLQSEGDITVLDVRYVSSDFHARYRAQERMYFYRLLSGPQCVSTFEKDRAWHVPEALDLSAMQKACKILAGHHDFSSFRSASCQAKSPIRTLDELSVTEVVSAPYFPSIMESEQHNLVNSFECSESKTGLACFSCAPEQNKAEDSNSESTQGFGMRRRHRCFVVTARSRSFLYHQVRLLVGTLKSVGTGDLTRSDVERILKAKAVTAASPMAPACGLYLAHVKYDLP